MKEQVRASILPNFIKGLALTVISIPFLIGITVKTIYGLAHIFQHAAHTGNGIDKIGSASKFIKFCWIISPNTDFNDYICWGNLLALIVVVGFAIGIGWMSKAYNDIFRLREAKRKAEDEELKNDYKSKR